MGEQQCRRTTSTIMVMALLTAAVVASVSAASIPPSMRSLPPHPFNASLDSKAWTDALSKLLEEETASRDATDFDRQMLQRLKANVASMASEGSVVPPRHRQGWTHLPEPQTDHIHGTFALVLANGYPVEKHVVRTDDGYLLSLFRIPNPGRPVAFLMHGLLSSSADFVVLGKGKALALLLHDSGFDVWMGNARGSTESRRHERLDPDDFWQRAEFWDFSWHEIGERDLPASIDHVLSATNQSALHYVGHSQGTTSFFVLGSERPEYMAKIKTFTALAPIAFLRDVRSIPVRLMALAPNFLAMLLRVVGAYEFLPSSSLVSWLGDTFCADGDVTQPICSNIMFLVCGFDSVELNKTMIPVFLVNAPAGAATKQLHHYGQNVHSKELAFRKFDYGRAKNERLYGSATPPEYDLSKVTAPTYLVYADNDLLSVKSNLDELRRRLPNVVRDGGIRDVRFRRFTHLDYIFGSHARALVYDDVVKTLVQHEEAEQLNFLDDQGPLF